MNYYIRFIIHYSLKNFLIVIYSNDCSINVQNKRRGYISIQKNKIPIYDIPIQKTSPLIMSII